MFPKNRLERDFKKEVVYFLKSYCKENIVIVNYVNIRYRGISDLLVCYKGCFLAIELKTGSKLTSSQELFLEDVKKAGGWGLVLYDGDDWEDVLTDFIHQLWWIRTKSPSKV